MDAADVWSSQRSARGATVCTTIDVVATVCEKPSWNLKSPCLSFLVPLLSPLLSEVNALGSLLLRRWPVP
jgi:hypothetical protein